MDDPQLYDCGKRLFISRREALAYLRDAGGPRQNRTARKLSVYHCKRCGGWHLTSQDRSAMQRQRKERRRQQAERRALEALIWGDAT